ncbi:MAG: hypothetical protein JWN14_638 [Chthonomonadales bacterium]|nr:hypothetical protein [Chthonomonadales bacterium]
MKTTLTQVIRRILYRYPAARMDKLIAYQLFRAEMSDNPDFFDRTNPDTFARTWRKHKNSF